MGGPLAGRPPIAKPQDQHSGSMKQITQQRQKIHRRDCHALRGWEFVNAEHFAKPAEERGPPPVLHWQPERAEWRIKRHGMPDLVFTPELFGADESPGLPSPAPGDDREEIARRPRTTAGPPRPRKKERPRRLEAARARPGLNPAINWPADLIPSTEESQANFFATVSRALGGVASLLFDDADNPKFARKLCDLWRRGPAALVKFGLLYTAGNMTRHGFEAELDRFLDEGDFHDTGHTA